MLVRTHYILSGMERGLSTMQKQDKEGGEET